MPQLAWKLLGESLPFSSLALSLGEAYGAVIPEHAGFANLYGLWTVTLQLACCFAPTVGGL